MGDLASLKSGRDDEEGDDMVDMPLLKKIHLEQCHDHRIMNMI